MRKSDKKYAAEYMLNPSASKFSGENVVYIGKWYYFILDEKKVKNTKILLCALSILQMFLFIAAGIYDTLATFTPYVFVPYIFLFLPLAMNIGCTASALSYKVKITHKQYDKKILVQKYYNISVLIISSAVLICDCVMLILNKEDLKPTEDLVFTLFVAIIDISSYVSLKNHRKLLCTTEC